MKLVPTTDLARRVGAIVHRKSETPWSAKEIQLYKGLLRNDAFNERDLKLIERYQVYHRKQLRRGGSGYHRRGLYTLLRWWGDELDRANEHDELHPIQQQPRKIIQMPPTPSEPPKPLSPEEQQRTADFCAEMLRRHPENKTWQRQFSVFQQQKQAEA